MSTATQASNNNASSLAPQHPMGALVQESTRTLDHVLPQGHTIQSNERTLCTETKVVDGKPVTRTIVRTKTYGTDPATGKVTETVREEDLGAAEGEARIHKEYEAIDAEMKSAHKRMVDEMNRMHRDFTKMWDRHLLW
eukprot:PhF_6_TR22315/c0_g1_i1/m.31586